MEIRYPSAQYQVDKIYGLEEEIKELKRKLQTERAVSAASQYELMIERNKAQNRAEWIIEKNQEIEKLKNEVEFLQTIRENQASLIAKLHEEKQSLRSELAEIKRGIACDPPTLVNPQVSTQIQTFQTMMEELRGIDAEVKETIRQRGYAEGQRDLLSEQIKTLERKEKVREINRYFSDRQSG